MDSEVNMNQHKPPFSKAVQGCDGLHKEGSGQQGLKDCLELNLLRDANKSFSKYLNGKDQGKDEPIAE